MSSREPAPGPPSRRAPPDDCRFRWDRRWDRIGQPRQKRWGGTMRRIWASGIAAACLLAVLALAPARAQSDFYKGKTISVVIGAKGGSLTLAGQIVAQHLGR